MDSPVPRIHDERPSISSAKRRRTLSSASDEQTQPVKCNRSKIRKSHAWRGVLHGIIDIPLEIVFEIFGYLEPLDILRLSRTSKDIRLLLMKSSSTFIWRRARQNVEGLPNLPFDLSEPAYANLAFSPLCHVCLVSRCERVIWECRTRCCKKCLQSAFIKFKEMQADSRYSVLFTRQIIHLVPQLSSHEWRNIHYSKSAADGLCEEVSRVLEDKALSLDEWKAYKNVQKGTIDEHAAQCELWERRVKIQRSIDREKAREQRVAAVKKRLTDIGWGEELQKLDRHSNARFRSLRGVRTAQPLTDTSWGKVKNVAINFLEKHRSDRWKIEQNRRYMILKECYTAHLKTRFSNCPIFPGLGDLIASKDFKTIIEETSLDRPLSAYDLEPAFARLPEFIMEWREEKEMELFKILCDAVPETRTGQELCRATTVFKCNKMDCGELLYYPDMFRHSCSTSTMFRASGGDEVHIAEEPYLSVGSQPWNEGKNRIVFHDSASRIAKRILVDAYRNPTLITSEDVKVWKPLVLCQTCQGMPMSWRDALQHDESHSLSIFGTGDTAQDQSGSKYSAQPGMHGILLAQQGWVFAVKCSFCSVSMAPAVLLDHLIIAHDIHSTTIDRSHWSFDFNTTILLTQPPPPQNPTPNPAPNMAPSPSSILGNPSINSMVPPAPDPLFADGFITNLSGGLEDFQASFFDGGSLDFERDFSQWFNPDESAGLDPMKN